MGSRFLRFFFALWVGAIWVACIPARADMQVEDLIQCEGAKCVPTSQNLVETLKSCFAGKSDAEKLEKCIKPNAASHLAALTPIFNAFMPYIPNDVRTQCVSADPGFKAMAGMFECMMDKLSPPIPRAEQLGRRLIGVAADANNYAAICIKLGGGCPPPHWAPKLIPPPNPGLPKDAETYTSTDILGKSPVPGGAGGTAGKTGQNGQKPPSFFGTPGCATGDQPSCTPAGGDDFAQLQREYGVSVSCMNHFLCDEAWTFARIMPSGNDVAMVRAGWQPYFEKLKDRYQKLRAEMLRRLMVQLGALTAAESTDCDKTIGDTVSTWRGKVDGCGGIGLGIVESALNSPDARARNKAICQAGNGGDAAAQAKFKERARSDAQDLLVERCALRYIQFFPRESASGDDHKERMQKVGDYESDFLSGSSCPSKAVATRAIERAKQISSFSLQFPMPYEQDKERSLQRARSRVACLESSVDARVLGLSDSDLLALSTGAKEAGTFAGSPAYQDLVSIFNRACAYGDDRSDLMRTIDGVNTGAYGLDELEALLGGTVPEDHNDFYDFMRGKVTACNRETRTKGSVESTLESLEKACGAFAKVNFLAAQAAAAGGPVTLGALAAVNAGCALPAVGMAQINSDKQGQLAAFRHSLGDQLSCDSASDLMEAEAALGQKVSESVISAAMQAGASAFEVAQVIRGAKNATEAERLIAMRARLASGAAKETVAVLPELKGIGTARLSGLVEEIEAQRPLRQAFPEGAAGDKAFAEANAAFDSRLRGALNDVKVASAGKTIDEMAEMLRARMKPEAPKIVVTDAALARAKSRVEQLFEQRMGAKAAAERFPCIKK